MIVNLPDELEVYVREEVASGEFNSAEEVIFDALMLHKYGDPDGVKRAELLRLIDEGVRSVKERPSVELTKGLLDSILARSRAKSVSREAEVS